MEGIHHHPTTGIFSESTYDADFGGSDTNLAPTIAVDPVPTRRVHTVHPISQIIGDITSPVLTRGTLKKSKFGECALTGYCCSSYLNDPDWVEAMQEGDCNSLLIRMCGSLCAHCPKGKLLLGQNGFLRDKRDAKDSVRNKSRLVAQGHRQEEGIDYDEVFAPVAQIEAIRLFLAFALYMGFMVFQMDVKSAFSDGKLMKKSMYTQPKGIEDPSTLNMCTEFGKLVCLHQAPGPYKSSDDINFGFTNHTGVMSLKVVEEGEFEKSAMGEVDLFLGHKSKATTPYGIFISQEKSMIGLLMYLTASRPDIMFAVSACSRHQVTPLTSNLNAVKKIFKYLKGQPKLGLWYPRDSPFVLEAYSDSDYAGSNGDRKSTTGGCQFLDRRLISWQCKKQTVVATSSTEAEYVAAAHCCGQQLSCILTPALTHNHTQATVESMAALKYRDEHNRIGFLEKPKGSTDYHQVIDFLLDSHIRYAIVSDPLIYASLITQFWSTASLRSSELGPPAIVATIDGTLYTITESLVRSQLQLHDEGGIVDMPIDKNQVCLLCEVILKQIPAFNFFCASLESITAIEMLGNGRRKKHKEEVKLEVDAVKEDSKTYVLTETFMYYQVFRGDGSSKNYKILSEMLEDFDRQDVEELYRLVKERYSTSRPEGFDLMLWGDLHTLFEPDEDDEIWKDQHEYKLLSWRLYDFSGIHILLMENGLAIHMLTEKKYPLSQEMLTKIFDKGVGSTAKFKAEQEQERLDHETAMKIQEELDAAERLFHDEL
ncbi:putative ribonuclease H-like domain-containing protein [Tanacetum coccineum]